MDVPVASERFMSRVDHANDELRPLATKPPSVRFIPLHDRILVRRIEAETERGGIIIPNNAVEKPQLADVLAVGKGKQLESGQVLPLDVVVGDRILFGKFSGSEVQLNGELLLILREDEVLGRIPE